MANPVPPALRPADDSFPLDHRIAVTIPTAAKLVDCSESTIRRAIKSGLLRPSDKLGRPLIPTEQLRRLLSDR